MDSSDETNELPVDDSQLDKHSTVDNESPLDGKIDEHTRLPILPIEEDIFGTQINYLAPIDECKFALHHNKPKKDMATVIVQEDYMCNQGDMTLIESIKNIPYATMDVELVCIGSQFLYMYLQIINSYIYLLIAQEHMKQRPGGTVHIEITFVSEFFKRDAGDDRKFDDIYCETSERSQVERRVLLYLQHDMVFIPINIRELHWYLVVLNAKRREIQILDSLGSSLGHKDLDCVLKGLQKQIDGVSHYMKLKDHNWPDLQVAYWPWKLIEFKDAKQTDSSSCGLFLLNYMEYWTGVELSDNFTQVYQKSYHIHIYNDMINNTIYFLTLQADIKHFRPKLAAILLSSDLNKRKGCPLYKNKTNKSTEDNETDSSGVEILEPSPNPNKRKRSPPISPEDDPISLYFEEICAKENNDVIPTPTSVNECGKDSLISGLSTKDMPVNKSDMIEFLCDYIMTIQDATILEAKWVRSFKPYRIDLTVKTLQELLNVNKDMPIDCFNMAVRILAHNEPNRLSLAKRRITKHYMDLRFCEMCGFDKESKSYKDPTAIELAETLTNWPQMNYYITLCKFVLMPWRYSTGYVLFIINHANKSVFVFNFTPIPEWCKDIPLKFFWEVMLLISKKYKAAYGVKRIGWSHDIYMWRHSIRPDAPIDLKGVNTGHFALHIMEWWESGLKAQFSMDGATLRRNLLIDLLTYEGNTYRFNMPVDIREYLDRIMVKD
ncbi:hypothetical protein ZEAMMB73_Zm00001d035351 [Zea mays]|uniref:Ubiquitin-like protease family profile domain-containing protein n=1 Tax=Zea mays TaxID=4577 RepID=A0A1D6LG53_MAIZE|nr:hypothetical protein ZEAMMB73_Zm00001d035351 [Zea mays]